MRSKFATAAAFVLVFPICAAFAIPITSINQLVVFGDSLSDNGNVSIATGGVLPGTNYYSRSYPGVLLPAGMYTDGPNTTPATASPTGLWIDQMASKIGVADPIPYLAGGTNYAFGGADTGHDTNALGVPFVTDQLGLFNSVHGSVAPSGALYTFWAGANDISDGKSPITAADNIYNNILTLSGEGAKYFMWLDLPPLGQTPNGLASGQSALLTGASNAFDAEWALDLAKLRAQGIIVVGVDINTLFLQIEGNPKAYGFTDITDPAQGNAAANPNNYVFWDGMHPTTAADALIANLAIADLVAPEPAGVLLAMVGMVGLLSCVRSLRSRLG